MVPEEILSERQNVRLLKKFLSSDEVAHMLKLAEGRWTRSTVVSNETGKSVVDDYRTGQLACLRPGEDESIKAIEERVANVTGTQIKQGESFQVIKYGPGEQYKVHHDWFDPILDAHREQMSKHGGQRVRTTMLILKPAESGGHTEFPNLALKVKPEAGDLLIWDNLDLHGRPTLDSDHIGCPVLEGEKIVATRWIRERAADGSEEPAALDAAAETRKRIDEAHQAAALAQQQVRNALEADAKYREEQCGKEIQAVLDKWACQLWAKPQVVIDHRDGKLQIGATVELDPIPPQTAIKK